MRHSPTTRRLLVVAIMLFGPHTGAASSLAATPGLAADGPLPPHAIALQAEQAPKAPTADSARYIIELVDPPLARLSSAASGGRPRVDALAPGRPFDAAGRLDTRSAPAVDHAAYLAERQAQFMDALRRVAPTAEALYHYQVAFNGVTVRLTRAEAEAARRLPGQRGVSVEEAVLPLMDASLPRIAAARAWSDPRVGGRADAGRGQRIAVIDSGISARHPFFDPSGFSAPEGFPRASLRIGDQVLDYPPTQRAEYTNAKVIVARTYVNPERVDPSAGDPLAVYTPLADGVGGFHGAHVAGIAAGSLARGAPGSSAGNLDLSGVAPGAYLMAYKFTDAYTPEILAMIDDAVADGADVINNSWGTAAMNVSAPAEHPVARAFEAASEAGVVVVAAAGNAGTNGEATLGGPQQMIESVITVANSQTGRRFAWKLYATGSELPSELAEHPTAYEPFENAFGVIEKPAARLADFCNPLGLAFGAAGKVVFEPLSGSCPIPGLDLPIALPDQLGWVTKLILAGVANAATPVPLVESIVFYGPDGDPQTLVTLLGFLDQVKPIFEQLGLAVKFPVVAIITGPDAMALADWADAHPGGLRLRLDSTPEARFDPSLDDAINPTSGQGPVPTALLASRAGVALKPDLSAPGTDIVSANTDADGAPDGYLTASGTSMASPHVAGAAAVVQQVHPDWGPAAIKAALMLTSDPSVTVDGATAPATVQGAGRLNLARAIDPGLLIMPPSVGLRWPGGTQDTLALVLADVRQDPVGGVTYRVRETPGPDGPRIFDLAPEASVSLAAGAETLFALRTRDAELPPGVYDGWIVFEEAESAAYTLRWRYRLEITGDRQDVLLINVRRSASGGAAPAIPGLPGLPG
ncbi:MAG: S8 family serine peptidase, partial [Chloroflexi bacterium]|nr:S8 family serine peptidase [Chloroflexota bacterium]